LNSAWAKGQRQIGAGREFEARAVVYVDAVCFDGALRQPYSVDVILLTDMPGPINEQIAIDPWIASRRVGQFAGDRVALDKTVLQICTGVALRIVRIERVVVEVDPGADEFQVFGKLSGSF
jgi:hypothetical protein